MANDKPFRTKWNERRNKAYALYVQSGTIYTLEEVGQLLDISVGSLKLWSSEEGWPEEREKYHDFLAKKKELSEQLTIKTLMAANNVKDPNDLYKLTCGLIGREKVDLIRQKILSEFKIEKPIVDEKFYKDIASGLHEKLLKRFAEDAEKYNAFRLIESDIMEELTHYE
jgi:hypothetical protein